MGCGFFPIFLGVSACIGCSCICAVGAGHQYAPKQASNRTNTQAPLVGAGTAYESQAPMTANRSGNSTARTAITTAREAQADRGVSIGGLDEGVIEEPLPVYLHPPTYEEHRGVEGGGIEDPPGYEYSVVNDEAV